MIDCPLCSGLGGELIAQTAHYRLIRADEAGFPLFYRLIWQRHVAEFSDLSQAERSICMEAVATVERVLRQQLPPDLRPTKINLASLGNVVPHLHWHIIARYDWDSHYPAPVWAAAQRSPDSAKLQTLGASLPQLHAALQTALKHAAA